MSFTGHGGHYGHTEQQLMCPKDSTPLEKRNERGVVMDVCPNCGTIVLDHGELPAIISQITSQQGYRPQTQVVQQHGHGHAYGYRHGHGHAHGHSYNRDRDIFDDLFDS